MKFDMRSCDLGIANSLPRPLGALSNSTPDGEYDYRRKYDYEYQERNQSLHCPGGLHHERVGGKAGGAGEAAETSGKAAGIFKTFLRKEKAKAGKSL